MTQPEELSAREASEQYDLSISYLIRLVKEGKIQGRRIGGYMWMLDRASLDAYTSQKRKPGPAKGTPAPWRKKAQEELKSEGRAVA